MVAIAAGICDGLQAGYNAKSSLLARGLAEISRLGAAMGATADTFFGIAGVGDLATSCFSPEGRNRSCGEALGKGLDDVLQERSGRVVAADHDAGNHTLVHRRARHEGALKRPGDRGRGDEHAGLLRSARQRRPGTSTWSHSAMLDHGFGIGLLRSG